MKIFSVILGNSKIEFSMWCVQGKYQSRVNEMVVHENVDYEMVRAELLHHLECDPIPYNYLLN